MLKVQFYKKSEKIFSNSAYTLDTTPRKKLERLILLDEDIADFSPFITAKGIFRGQSQSVIAPLGSLSIGGFVYDDGSSYFGQWNSKGEKEGFGYLILPDSTRFVGGFQNGLFHGLGVMAFPDGARYEGEFMQGWFHGHGVFLRTDGMKFEGQFRGGTLWGWGLVTFNDSTHGFPRSEGFFQDCKIIRNKKCEEVIEKARKIATLARLLEKNGN